MYLDGWNTPTQEALASLHREFGSHGHLWMDGRLLVDRATEIHDRPIRFYDDVVLRRIRDERWNRPTLAVYFMMRPGELYRLNGTSPPIHEVNRRSPIRLIDDNVLEYLSFFTFFVRKDGNPFYLINGLTDPHVPAAVWDFRGLRQGDRSVRELFRPLTLHGFSGGNYRASALMIHSTSVYFVDLSVAQKTGEVIMVSDEPLIEDLPQAVVRPIVVGPQDY
jgi:hypothetical protein